MTSNAEKALSYAMSLAHATAGGGLRRTPELIIEEAEKKKVKLVVFSHESDGGRELSGFGGLAALLKFRMR